MNHSSWDETPIQTQYSLQVIDLQEKQACDKSWMAAMLDTSATSHRDYASAKVCTGSRYVMSCITTSGCYRTESDLKPRFSNDALEWLIDWLIVWLTRLISTQLNSFVELSRVASDDVIKPLRRTTSCSAHQTDVCNEYVSKWQLNPMSDNIRSNNNKHIENTFFIFILFYHPWDIWEQIVQALNYSSDMNNNA